MFTVLQRLLRHAFSPLRNPVPDEATMQRLTECVAASEKLHSGEIRICIESRLPASYLSRPHDMPRIVRQRAVSQFAKLRVWDTERNNGVLIYLQLAERRIEIVADRGIQRLVGPRVWQDIVTAMVEPLRAGNHEGALQLAIVEVGQLLGRHFPRNDTNATVNELPDRPVVE